MDRVGNLRVRSQKQRKMCPGVGILPPEDPGRLVCGWSEKAGCVAMLASWAENPSCLVARDPDQPLFCAVWVIPLLFHT